MLTGLCSVGVISAHAQSVISDPAAQPAAHSVSVAASSTLTSQYMFRGVRLGGFSFQPSVTGTYGNATLGIWSNFPLDNDVPGQSDPEFDYTGAYTIKLGENLSVVPGFTIYHYPRAETSNGFYRSTFEPSLAVNYTVAGVTLTPKFYYDVTLDGPTYELSAAYTFPLDALHTGLTFGGTLGTFIQKHVSNHASPAVKNWGDYWLLGVSAPFTLTEQSKLVVGWAYTEGSNNYLKQGQAPRSENSSAVGRGVFTVNYIFTF